MLDNHRSIRHNLAIPSRQAAMVSGSAQQMFFTSLRLANWRNFKRAHVLLKRRAFFVGPNASGKSNLLDVLRFLRDVVSVGGGFQAAVGRRGGVGAIRCLAARQNPRVELEVWVGTEERPRAWTYTLHFNGQRGKPPAITRELVKKGDSLMLDRPDEHDKADPERLHQTALEQVTANKTFREIAEFFGSVTYLHLVPQLLREPDRTVVPRNDPFGRDLLERLAQAPKRTREKGLQRINDALRTAVPQLRELKLEQDNKGLWHLRALYAHWRPLGAWQDETSLSDGTLRLLGLLWSILESGGPLLLEEPELSLHPAVVRSIPAMLHQMQVQSGRQVLVTTHSADLLADEQIGLDEVHLITVGDEASAVVPASTRDKIVALVNAGLPIGEAALPEVQPRGAEQLALFEPA